MQVSYIFAMDRNRGIGFENKLPWRLPADLAFFKKTTLGHPVVMGRRTFDSLGGRTLPGRTNIVLTQNRSYTAEGCEVVHSADEAVERFGGAGELFVIGGTEAFRLFMPYVMRMYITRIEHEFVCDVFFDGLPEREWKLVSSEKGPRDEKNPYDYYFEVYERVDV
nr:Dihydrofolate reductase [uncultured bacterium]